MQAFTTAIGATRGMMDLADGPAEATAPQAAVAPHLQHLVRTPGGGFLIETDGQSLIQAQTAAGGFCIERDPDIRSWTLVRSTDRGFILRDSRENELGRTMPSLGAAGASGLKYMLLDDARLFRIVLCGPRDPRFELLGWETPGPYLLGRPAARGWVLVPTPAASGLVGLAPLSILFAAEILDAEEAAPAGAHEQA